MEEAHVCVIGAGKHARANIYPTLALIPEVTIDAVCTRHLENAERMLQRIGSSGRAYDDVNAMLVRESCEKVLIIMQAEDAYDAAFRCVQA